MPARCRSQPTRAPSPPSRLARMPAPTGRARMWALAPIAGKPTASRTSTRSSCRGRARHEQGRLARAPRDQALIDDTAGMYPPAKLLRRAGIVARVQELQECRAGESASVELERCERVELVLRERHRDELVDLAGGLG